MRRYIPRRLALLALPLLAVPGTAQYALFALPTDTILVPGDSTLGTTFTAEARVRLSSAVPTPVGIPDGLFMPIFTEQYGGVEDKSLSAGPSGIVGSAWRTFNDAYWMAITLCPDTWFHIAFVYDGTEERIYLNGILRGSRPRSGPMSNSGSSVMTVGAFQEPAGPFEFRESFRGYVDTVRISSTARYSGPAFTPPPGDLPADGAAFLVYNFNEPPGSATVADSASGWTGTLGAGFAGATSPALTGTLVPSIGPGTVGVVGINDLTIEGAGSGGCCGAGTTVVLPVGPLVLDLMITSVPGTMVVGAFSPFTVCNAVAIDPVYSIDLPLALLFPWYNFPIGSAVPGFPLASAFVNGGGIWALSMSVDVPPGFSGALQFALLGPAFPSGVGTTQAILIASM